MDERMIVCIKIVTLVGSWLEDISQDEWEELFKARYASKSLQIKEVWVEEVELERSEQLKEAAFHGVRVGNARKEEESEMNNHLWEENGIFWKVILLVCLLKVREIQNNKNEEAWTENKGADSCAKEGQGSSSKYNDP